MNIAQGKLEPERPSLGDRLRGLREQHGLSLRELAAQVGVTATALHAWENGRRNPKYKHLRAFAAAFQLNPTELLPAPGANAGESVREVRATHLATVLAESKVRIAAAAGVPAERVKIIIEV